MLDHTRHGAIVIVPELEIRSRCAPPSAGHALDVQVCLALPPGFEQRVGVEKKSHG